MNPAILWLLALIGVIGSALFSGLEMGIYSLNRVRLHLLTHRGDPRAVILSQLTGRAHVLMTTLLIGNNMANFLISSATGILLKNRGHSELGVVVVVTLVITPLLFIFGEVLPKDLFAAYADRLVYPFARFLRALQRLFTGLLILPLITATGELMMRLLGSRGPGQAFHPRRQFGQLVREGLGQGLLSDEQSAIIERVLELSGRSVEDEMVPWGKAVFVNLADEPAVLWELANRTSLSRYPVLDRGGQVVGVVSLYDALIHEKDQCPPIAPLMKPALTLPRQLPLRAALDRMQESGSALAVVTDQRGRPVGLVTMKDLVEPITGELVSW